MAVGNINELPENILLELFTHVPARQLLRPAAWSAASGVTSSNQTSGSAVPARGLHHRDWDQPVADWKVFYFLRSSTGTSCITHVPKVGC